MRDLPDPPEPPRRRTALSHHERARLDEARRTLAASRVIDLASLGEAGLITLVENLRAGLDTSILLLDDLAP